MKTKQKSIVKSIKISLLCQQQKRNRNKFRRKRKRKGKKRRRSKSSSIKRGGECNRKDTSKEV